MISVRMLKICDKCYEIPQTYFQIMSVSGFFSEWEKANVAPIHTKNDKQCMENYQSHFSRYVVQFLDAIFINIFMFGRK